jgi:hypothetical protein
MMQQDKEHNDAAGLQASPDWRHIKRDGVETNGTVDVEECHNIVTTLS